jgi:hypothetical protein
MNPRETNKETIKQIMKDLDITNFIIEYNGCGDDGQIEHIGINKPKMQSIETKYEYHSFHNVVGPDKQYHKVLKQTSYDIEEFLENYCYDILSEEESGWELDDGSSGSFQFDIKDDTISIKLEHYAHIQEEEEESETTF